MKFRKKPVEIEAFQHFADMGTRTIQLPVWAVKAITQGYIFAKDGETFIATLEGDMKVSDGDWIIKGVIGELYPCKPDIFAATYEPV